MNANQILASNLNKSEKARRLSALGWTVQQIADAVGMGYGFAWVVVNKRNATLTQVIAAFIIDYTFTRKFGIEIEAYGVGRSTLLSALRRTGLSVICESRSTAAPNAWKVTSDASISGALGFEIVSPILIGEEGMEQVRKVSQALISCRAKINRTCGLHVHFDAQSMGIETWKRLYKNYIKLEDTIDSMMPTSRRSNTYCKSLKINDIETRINGCRTVTQIANLYGSRYFKVNAESYTKHNTVEFRQHSGTIEIEKIENWVRFLDGLVKYSEREIIETGDFQSLNKFCQPELLNYLHTRIQSLNA